MGTVSDIDEVGGIGTLNFSGSCAKVVASWYLNCQHLE